MSAVATRTPLVDSARNSTFTEFCRVDNTTRRLCSATSVWKFSVCRRGWISSQDVIKLYTSCSNAEHYNAWKGELGWVGGSPRGAHRPEKAAARVTQAEVTRKDRSARGEVTRSEATQPEVTRAEVTRAEVTRAEVIRAEVTRAANSEGYPKGAFKEGKTGESSESLCQQVGSWHNLHSWRGGSLTG